ncbi:hypothetical protein LMH87_006541 [Akanthomyces muscarius]|uniref:Uncharacterized protein n=1 Tax=Akanthomyces muscarius TaxID=2231603 RepID=A0A9W8UQE8_AKAMU|nr:hypothetical protein LMH87_006541 [Akanthomyces muscarius]KAJ4164887.1 hypothetical protein LMH87_006541 [Akanthomyces muscarius]
MEWTQLCLASPSPEPSFHRRVSAHLQRPFPGTISRWHCPACPISLITWVVQSPSDWYMYLQKRLDS